MRHLVNQSAKAFANRIRIRLPASVKRFRETEAGQTLVEFTLIMPIFLCLLFALVDFGRGFYGWLLVTNAAREGARAAAVQSDWATTQSAVWNSFCNPYPGNCALNTGQIAIANPGGNIQGLRGSAVSVQVSYTFTYVTPLGSLVTLLGGSALAAPVITSTETMRLE